MAVKTFEETLAQLSADERKLLDNTFAKHPELKEGWLRQDDYSRNMNSLKEQKTKLEDDLAYAEKMKDWADRNVPKWDALAEKGIIDKETGDELWTSQKAELERQLDEAKKQLVGGEMDPAELDRRVKEIVTASGGVTKDEMNALIQSEAKKLAKETFAEEWGVKETNFNEKTIPFVAGFSAATAVAAAKYEKETGKPWTADTAKEFFGKMSEEKNFDPYAVIDKFIEPIKKGKETETEIERLKAENERLKAGRGMPGGGDERAIPQEKGALQMMLERSADGDFESMIKGKAVEAATELIAEGKG